MAKIEQAQFVHEFETYGPAYMRDKHDMAIRSIMSRRKTVENLIGRPLVSPIGPGGKPRAPGRGNHRLEWKIENGEVLIGSDAHIWNDKYTPAMRAFVKFAKERNPKGIILNGDIFDGAAISRHAPIMWERSPSVIEELEAVQNWLNELVLSAPKKALMAWPQGNHDARFESRLADRAHEYAKIKGFHLKDHFSNRLTPCWSVWINDQVVVRHRGRGGDHAVWNNTIRSGKTIVTGHLHSPKVVPFRDYNPGTRYGVDCGCLADPYGPQFLAYTEDGFRNHGSGFAVLKFVNGELLEPSLCLTWDDNHVQFRGEIIKV
jgi:predicted phosphodiesterase